MTRIIIFRTAKFGLKIFMLPKVLSQRLIIHFNSNPDWLVQTSSDQAFQPIISIHRLCNLAYRHLRCTSIQFLMTTVKNIGTYHTGYLSHRIIDSFPRILK